MRRLLMALPIVVMVACTYDWTVGPPGGSSDGGGQGDGGGSSGDASQADTSVPGDASSSCDGLQGQVGLTHLRIIACGAGGACGQTVKDECNCDIPVADASSSAARDYVNAVNAYKNAGCADCSDRSCS